MKILFSQFTLLLCFCLSIHIANGQEENTTGKNWWKETVFYEIYMPSYADSNGDGYGDFKGMTSKLDYLQSLGIKGIWLTPFLQSPKVDNGYDVADYYDIDSTYGNMADFKNFLATAHQKGIKLIMDMVLNHSSTDCKWFQEARKSKDNPYRNYYIWKDKPNNWESFFGGTAWEFDTLTKQYYYHKFDKKMADLNWTNPKLVEEMKNVLRFWLDMGVDGFRFDVINFLTTDGITADNPVKDGKQEHLNDINQDWLRLTMNKIKMVVNEYKDRFIVGEIGSDKIKVLKQYSTPEYMDVVFNFNFGSIAKFSRQRIFEELKSMEDNMQSFPTLFFGSHDMPRMIDRLADGNQERAVALAALMLTAKGVPFIYYGEEIGMHNITANNLEEIKDIQGRTHYQMAINEGKDAPAALIEGNNNNRDKSRSPMQWNGNVLAGFSNNNSWIKINPDYKEVNVISMQNDKSSILNKYQELITLRNNEPVLQYGEYEILEYEGEYISYTRSYKKDKITVIINFGPENKLDLSLPKGARILMGSLPLKTNGFIIYRN